MANGIEAAEAEVKRFFKPDDIFEYDKSEFLHVYAEDERAI